MAGDRASVEEFFTRVADGWKTNDGQALARFFVDEGTLINPFGQRADGRDAVAAMYSEFFGEMLKGTTTEVIVSSVRAVEGNHAFADGEQTIYGSDGEVVLAAHISALLRREGNEWRFVDARPYTIPARGPVRGRARKA